MASNAQFQIKIGVNSSGVRTGIEQAVDQVDRLSGAFKKILGPNSVMGGTLVAIGKFIKDQAAWAATLSDTADNLGTTTDRLQGLKYAAAATTTEFSEFESAINKVRKSQAEALLGDEKTIKNFQRLGVTLRQLKILSAADVFIQISKAVEAGNLSTANYAALLDIVGKESSKLIAAMKDGAGGMAEAFEKSSLVIRSNMITALDDANTGVNSLWATFKGFTRWVSVNTAAGVVSLSKAVVGLGAHIALKGGELPARRKDMIWNGTGYVDPPDAMGTQLDPDTNETLRELRDKMATERELQYDEEYEASLKITKQLEEQLNLKLGIKKIEKETADKAEKKRLESVKTEDVRRMLETAKSIQDSEEKAKLHKKGFDTGVSSITSNQQIGARIRVASPNESALNKNTNALDMVRRTIQEWDKKAQRTQMGGINEFQSGAY